MQHGMKGSTFRMGAKVPSKRLRLSLAQSDPAGALNDETLAAAAANCEQLEQVRDELASARFRMRAVLDAAGDEYLQIDRNRRVLDLNEIVLKALGRTRSDCVGQHFWDLVASAGYRAAVDKAIQRDRPVQLETASAFYPGRMVRLAVLPDDDGLALFGRDITALTRATETSDGQIALLQSVIDSCIGPCPDPRQSRQRRLRQQGAGGLGRGFAPRPHLHGRRPLSRHRRFRARRRS